MTKRLFLLLIAIIAFSACKKNDENQIFLSSRAYLDSSAVLANYAVISTMDSAVIQDENTVDAYFKSLPEGPTNFRLSVKRFDYFLPAGNYIVVIQLETPLLLDGRKTYTYKRVSITEGTKVDPNIMFFKSDRNAPYQEWVTN
jgi:hypothetical protein